MSARRRSRRRPWQVGEDGDRVAHERLARFLSEWCEVWDVCGCETCHRARACCDPRLKCYETCGDILFDMLYEAPCMRAFHQAIQDLEDEPENA